MIAIRKDLLDQVGIEVIPLEDKDAFGIYLNGILIAEFSSKDL